jgi:Uma2 family endonuclease
MATRTVLTYKDYEALPADGRRYEIHDGELSVTLAPSPRHQQVSGNLFFLLRRHVESRGLGMVLYAPIDCILSETTIVQPDLVYLAVDRLTAISGRGIEGPPTLVIEILSPSTSLIDRGTKRQLYSRYGVPCYWILDPDARTIEAFRLARGVYDLTARMEGAQPIAFAPLPELILDPAGVWA